MADITTGISKPGALGDPQPLPTMPMAPPLPYQRPSTKVNNPVLDELDRLSPQAKDALSRAHQSIASVQPPPEVAPNPMQSAQIPGGAPRLSSPPAYTPKPLGGVSPASSVGAPPPMTPDQQGHTDERNRLLTSGSGVSQIKSPWARIPLQIADAIGGAFLPGLEQRLPGTEGHHEFMVNRADNAVKADTAQREGEGKVATDAAQAGHLQSQIPLTQADTALKTAELPRTQTLAGEEQTKADALPQTITDEHNLKEAQAGEANERAESLKHPAQKPEHMQLPDGTVLGITFDQKTGQFKSDVVYKGDPKTETELAKLQVGGKPHSVIVDKRTGQTIKDLGETGEKPPTVNVNAGTAALDRETTHFAGPHQKALDAANSQLEKMEEARAMLSTGTAESQALAVPKVMTALVSGAGSGVRITQPELNAIAGARGVKGDFEGWLSKISSGKKLTSEQSNQLKEIVQDAEKRVVQKRQIYNDALNRINGAGSRDEIVQADSAARKAISDLENGGHGGGASPTVTSKAEYDKLPSGAFYMEDGKKYKKP